MRRKRPMHWNGLLIAAVLILGWSRPAVAVFDDCDSYSYGSWNCSSGSVTNSGYLSVTNATICLGNSVISIANGVGISNGSKSRWATDGCNTWTDGPYVVNNMAVYWWVPSLPSVFTTNGTFVYTNMVMGVSQDTDCPGDTPIAVVGTLTVTVTNSLPVIFTQPTNQTVLIGSNCTFSVVASGCPSVAYQWWFNATNMISGATNSLLILTNVQATNSGNYSVVVSDYSGSNTSSNAVLSILPVIITQPTNQTVLAGSNMTLSVTATGTAPLTYQWYVGSFTNSAVLFGATNAMLVFDNVQPSYSNSYFVVVANVYGSTTSSNAVLTVLAPPSIIVQPTNQMVNVGSNVTVSVTATGTMPLNYQWYGTNSGLLVGATNAALVFTSVQTNNADGYYVSVTNAFGSVTSSVAVLTVLAPPVITVQPTNQTVNVGSNAIFSVTATGAAPLSYQWYGTNSGMVAGAINATLVLTNIQANNADSYYVVVTNIFGSATSSNAVLTVPGPPAVSITNPLSNSIFIGASTNISMTAVASDVVGTISQIEFFQETTSLGTVSNAPYSLVWSNATPGIYALTACATDNYGLASTSSVVNVTIMLAPVVQDFGFELPVAGTAHQISTPSGTPWSYTGNSGVADNGVATNSGSWLAVQSPQGNQAAYLNNTATISQSVLFTNGVYSNGIYTISFIASSDGTAGGSDPFNVEVDGVLVGSFYPTNSAYSNYVTSPFIVSDGYHTIAFVGTGTGSQTAMIDDVAVSPQMFTVEPFDFGFELPVAGTAHQISTPSGTPWSYTGNSGVADNGVATNSGSWLAVQSPQGNQAAYLNNTATISQSVLFTNGVYSISFIASSDGTADGSDPFNVEVDGVIVGSFYPTNSAYSNYVTSPFIVSGGYHTIAFVGTGTGSQTAMIDDVTVNPLPLSSLPPPNDNFANAQTITLGSTTGTNISATLESGEAGLGGGHTIWYTFTATNNGWLAISAAGNSFQLVIGLGAALSYGEWNGDKVIGTNLLVAHINDTWTYYICIDGDSTDSVGSISLNMSYTNQPPVTMATFTTTNLLFWLKADAISGLTNNATVGVWTDSSGCGNNATQSNPGNQPFYLTNAIGNYPVVHFDGTNRYFSLTEFLDAQTQAEAFVVLKANTPASGVANPLWQLGGYYFTYESYPDADGTIKEDFGTYNVNQPFNLGVPAQPLGQYHVYDVLSQTNNWEAWINGNLLFQSTNNAVSFQGVPTWNTPLLGSDTAYGTTSYFSGDIAEIFIFSRGLTADERIAVNNYLLGKYSAALSMPPTPWNLAATPISPTQISLSWSATLNGTATQISVERSTASNGVFSIVGQVNGIHIYDTNLTAGTTYYYRVQAINTNYTTSNSAYSSIVQATTFASGPTLPLPLALWLRADTGMTTNTSGLISTWADQSGNGNDATQTATNYQPVWMLNTNGNPVAHFNGTNSYFNLPDFMNGATGAEAFVVLKAATDYPASLQSLWEFGGDAWDSKAYPDTDGSIRDDFGSTIVQYEGIPSQPINQFHVYQVSSQTNNWSAWINGILQYQAGNNMVSFAAGSTLGTAPYEEYIVGWTTANGYFAGDIAEVLVFNRGLTAGERTTINSYLNGKYDLVPAVPATPSNLVAMAISPTQVALTWDEPLNGGATQIGIERSTTSNGTYAVVAQIPGATSYVDTNLTPGTTYYYQVQAINLTQWSPTSNVAQATTPTNGMNLPFGSLALWLKADAGLLQGSTNTLENQWGDQSGNGNNAFQTTVASDPVWVPGVIGDRPVVRFNGTNSYFNLPSFMNGATGAEAFVVLKVVTNYPASLQSLWEMGGDSWNSKAYPDIDGSVGDDFGSAGGAGNSGVHELGNPVQSLSQYHVYEVSSQTNNWAAWINGVLAAQNTGNTVSFSSTPSLGMSTYETYITGWTTANGYFAGDIAEVLVFNRGLTAGERTTINSYLNGKYDLVPAVPVTPSNLVATAVSPTQIGLSWDETLNGGATRVSIERLTPGIWTYQVVTQVAGATSYVDTNLSVGTTYYYRVRAINVTQWSGYSGVAQATTLTAGTDIPFGSLALWLKADAGLLQSSTNTPVNLWADGSGNANNAVQLTVTNRPSWVPVAVGGRPAVFFGGTNSFFGLPNFLNGANSAEAFVVLKVATNHPSSSQSLWEFGGDAWDSKAYTDTDGSIRDDFGSTTVQSLGIPAQPLTQYHVYEVSSQQDDWEAWINGNLLYQTSETGFNTVSFAAAMNLGHTIYEVDDPYDPFLYSADSYFAGNIGEVLVFNRTLTAGERLAVNNYLNGKYGLTPVISITAPANNAVLMGPTNISISATAGDSAGISQVQFFQGSSSLGIVTNSPYNLVWSNVAFGSYSLTARATDGNGLVFTSAVVNVTVAGIAITTPTNNSVLPVPANIPVNASVVDGAGISQVQFFQGTSSIVIVTNAPYSFIWSNVTSGSYALTACATDNNGLTLTSSIVNVTVDSLPTVTVTNPVNDARFAAGTNITLAASATASDGTIAQVQFFQGTNSLGVVTSSPYSLVWTNVPFGAYALTACAADNNGLIATSAVVNITVVGIAITSPTNNVVLSAGVNLPIAAAVTDNVGISQVQFFQGATSLGIVSTSPYSLVWTSIPSGIYALTASATDTAGLSVTSSVVNVIVDTNPNSTDTDGDGVSDYIEYLEGRNPLVNGAVPDTNGIINLQIYTPLH